MKVQIGSQIKVPSGATEEFYTITAVNLPLVIACSLRLQDTQEYHFEELEEEKEQRVTKVGEHEVLRTVYKRKRDL